MFMHGLFHKNYTIPPSPTPPEPEPDPDPTIVDPNILNISNGPVTVDSSTYIPMNANYIKNDETLIYENQYNNQSQYEELETQTDIHKYTMDEFLCELLHVEDNYSSELITGIYIDDELQENLNGDSYIYIIRTNAGPTPVYTNFLYYKLGDNPVGVYLKNNLTFHFIDRLFETEETISCENNIRGMQQELYREFELTYDSLPSSITVTAVQS